MHRLAFVLPATILLLGGGAASCAAGSVDATPPDGVVAGDDGSVRAEGGSTEGGELDAPWPGETGAPDATRTDAGAEAGPDVADGGDGPVEASSRDAGDGGDASIDTGLDAPDDTMDDTAGDTTNDTSADAESDVTTDAGPDAPADAGSDVDSGILTKPGLGDVLITEVMFNPSGTEPQAEWFEVYNLTTAPKLLSGLTIKDGYPRTHDIPASPQLILPPGMYVLLVRDRATAIATLVPAAAIVYEYGTGLASNQGIQLSNGTDGGVSLWDGATELANVPYGPWGMSSNGMSIELTGLTYPGSDQQTRWCLAARPWTTGSDDGTPGAASDCP